MKSTLNNTTSFIGSLFSEVPDSSSILVWNLRGKKSSWFDNPIDAANFARGKTDCYIGCSLQNIDDAITASKQANYQKGTPDRFQTIDGITKDNVRGVHHTAKAIGGLWADIDFVTEHTKKKLPPTEKEAVVLAKSILLPSIIIHTGHGVQAWWLFNELLELNNDNRDDVASVVLKWQAAIRKIANQSGWTIDSTFDLSRVMRIPGTFNCKIKGEKLPVKIIEENQTRYEITDFGPYLPEILQNEKALKEEQLDFVIDENNASLPMKKWGLLCETDPRIKLTWDRKRTDFADKSASSYDMSLARFAVQAGWSDQEIVNLLISHRLQHNDVIKRADYFRTTIIKAKSQHQQVNAYDRLETILDTNQLNGEQIDATEQKNIILADLSTTLGVTLTRVVKYLSDPPQYRLETNLGKIHLGNVACLIEQTQFKQKLAAATGVLMSRYKTAKWDKIAQALLSVCELVSAGMEATDDGSIEVWLQGYLFEDSSLNTPPLEAIQGKLPFTMDGKVYFFLQGLRKWLRVAHNETLSSRALSPMLKSFGAENKSKRIGDKVFWVWELKNGL